MSCRCGNESNCCKDKQVNHQTPLFWMVLVIMGHFPAFSHMPGTLERLLFLFIIYLLRFCSISAFFIWYLWYLCIKCLILTILLIFDQLIKYLSQFYWLLHYFLLCYKCMGHPNVAPRFVQWTSCGFVIPGLGKHCRFQT